MKKLFFILLFITMLLPSMAQQKMLFLKSNETNL